MSKKADLLKKQELEDAFREGYSAYQNGIHIHDNPYDYHTQRELADEWDDGYYEAGWDD